MGVVRVEKVCVNCIPDRVGLNGEWTYMYLVGASKFGLVMLMKRFYQVASLVTTEPKNVVKKLTDIAFFDKLEIKNEDNEIVMMMENGEIHTWTTRRGFDIYIVPFEDDVLAFFTTKGGNRYIVEIPQKYIASFNP